VLRTWSCALLAVAAWLLCAAAVRAAAPAVHFSWQRPVGSMCPTREALEADIEALMERRVFVGRDDAQVIVRGVARESSDGATVEIEAVSDRGEVIGTRELSAPAGECATLRSAIALVLTMFIEHEAATREDGEVALGIGGELSLTQAPLPRMAFAVGPALSLSLGDLVQLHAVAAYWLPVAIETPSGVGATVEAASLELRGCTRFWAGLGLCTGFEGGALIASPRRLNGPERQVRLLAHALLEAAFELDLGGAARIDAAAGAILSLSRPELSYLTGEGARRAVYRPQQLGMNFRLSIIIPTE
jgi:hypothetical protein